MMDWIGLMIGWAINVVMAAALPELIAANRRARDLDGASAGSRHHRKNGGEP